jgi:hypothetical protein
VPDRGEVGLTLNPLLGEPAGGAHAPNQRYDTEETDLHEREAAQSPPWDPQQVTCATLRTSQPRAHRLSVEHDHADHDSARYDGRESTGSMCR